MQVGHRWQSVTLPASASTIAAPTVVRASELNVLLSRPESPLGGNKALKIAPWLKHAKEGGYQGVIGFGGAYSNFILSLALSCRDAGLKSFGIIRGEEVSTSLSDGSNRLLAASAQAGMRFEFVSRADYRLRHFQSRNPARTAEEQEASLALQQRLQRQFPDYLIIAEGGSSAAAAKSCCSIISDPDEQASAITHWIVPVGTGATAAGVAAALAPSQRLIAVAVTNDPAVRGNVAGWLNAIDSDAGKASCAKRIDWHQAETPPRYGKLDQAHCDTINECFSESGVLLDPVYTVKALHTWRRLMANSSLPAQAQAALIHTGGLSGWLGMQPQWKRWLSGDVENAIEQTLQDIYG